MIRSSAQPLPLTAAQPRHGVDGTDVVQDSSPQGVAESGSQKLVDGAVVTMLELIGREHVCLPLAVDGRTAAMLFAISTRHWARLDSAGRCPMPVRIGRSVRWLMSDLIAWSAEGCRSRSQFEDAKRARCRARARRAR